MFDIQAHFEKKIFFWEKREKSIKCPVLYAQFEEKLTFFGIFVVKTQWIIGQKIQHSARYAGAFWGKKSLFLGGWELRRTPAALGNKVTQKVF